MAVDSTSARFSEAPGDRAKFSLLATFGLLAGPLVSMLDSSIVNVAIPVLTRDLHADLAAVQ